MSAQESLPLQLISGRQDRLERRIDEVEDDVKEIPELRKEVQLMTDSFVAFRNALLTATGVIVATAIGILLLQRGGL